MTENLIGRRLGDFVLLEIVRKHRGSTTFRARAGERDVAVTVLPEAANRAAVDHTLASVRRIAELRHPNIAPIAQVGVALEWVYFVTADTGVHRTVADLTAPVAPGRAVGLLAPVLAALDHAHRHGVVHADITPRRIVLPSPTWPMLTDFSIDTAVRDTQAGGGRRLVLGTPAYLAPEQAFGLAAGAPADVYSLAVVGYELVTGRVPFPAETPGEVLRMQALEPPPPPGRIREDLPAGVDEALLAALSKDPSQRPTPSRLAEMLQAAVTAKSRPSTVSSAPGAGPVGHARDYADGVRAFADGRWQEAVVLLGSVADYDPGFEDVEVLLHAARQALAQGED